MSKRKTEAVKKPLASSPEWMRQYRLRHNQDVYSRIAIKARNYLTVEQAEKIEAAINKIISWPKE